MTAKVAAAAGVVAAFAAAVATTATGLAAIANPIGLLISSVAALSAGALTLTGNWKNAINSVVATFQAVNRHVDQTIGAIMDAFASGDLKNAVKVVWAEIKFLFVHGLPHQEKTEVCYEQAAGQVQVVAE